MKTVGIHDLEAHIGEILRQVQEEGETVEVTDGGEPIVLLIPVLNHKARQGDDTQAIDIDDLVNEISAYWPDGVSAVDAVRDVRR